MSLKLQSYEEPMKATWVSEVGWLVSLLNFKHLFDVAPDTHCHEGLAKVTSLSNFSEEDRHWDSKYIHFTNIEDKFKNFKNIVQTNTNISMGQIRAVISR